MDDVKTYFSQGFYSNVWDDLFNAHHGVVQGDIDGTDSNTLVQLNPYHHESVFDHIHWVYELAVETGNQDVILASSIHDIAKAYMRYYVRDKNRVRFSGHEYASALFSVNFLRERVPPDRLLGFLKVICLHVLSYSGNPYEYDLSEEDISLLKGLNTVDNNGRRTDNPRELTFSNWDKDKFVEQQEPLPDTPIYTILIGIPGSGKSTYTKTVSDKVFSTDDTLERIAEDEYGIINDYPKAFEAVSGGNRNWVAETIDNSLEHVKHGNNVIFDATNLTRSKRKGISNRAKRLGAHVKFVMFWRDFSECVGCRNDEKYIPEGVFKRMLSSFSYPKRDEYDSFEHVII